MTPGTSPKFSGTLLNCGMPDARSVNAERPAEAGCAKNGVSVELFHSQQEQNLAVFHCRREGHSGSRKRLDDEEPTVAAMQMPGLSVTRPPTLMTGLATRSGEIEPRRFYGGGGMRSEVAGNSRGFCNGLK